MQLIQTNSIQKYGLFYPELSYKTTGILFKAHSALGAFAREKQYGDLIAEKLDEAGIKYKRELPIGSSGNIADFVIENKIILELKAKRVIVRDDYEQLQRYLQESNLNLGILVNFRNKYIKPSRVVKKDALVLSH